MSETSFYGFLSGGLGLLIAVGLLIAWQLWRAREERRDNAVEALKGVGHEMRLNLQRMVSEITQICVTEEAGPDALLPIRHPQLDAVNAALIPANRDAIAVLSSTYQELEARKMALRAALAQRRDSSEALDYAMDAAINGIAMLYLWEAHKGARPSEVHSVRSWSVRDWMKDHKFVVDAFPGLHLRDEVVERLRSYGMALTPKPLTHTAHEYYSMQYDRKADPRSPFGKRRLDDEASTDDALPVIATAAATPDFVDPEPQAPEAFMDEPVMDEPVAETEFETDLATRLPDDDDLSDDLALDEDDNTPDGPKSFMN